MHNKNTPCVFIFLQQTGVHFPERLASLGNHGVAIKAPPKPLEHRCFSEFQSRQRLRKLAFHFLSI